MTSPARPPENEKPATAKSITLEELARQKLDAKTCKLINEIELLDSDESIGIKIGKKRVLLVVSCSRKTAGVMLLVIVFGVAGLGQRLYSRIEKTVTQDEVNLRQAGK